MGKYYVFFSLVTARYVPSYASDYSFSSDLTFAMQMIPNFRIARKGIAFKLVAKLAGGNERLPQGLNKSVRWYLIFSFIQANFCCYCISKGTEI